MMEKITLEYIRNHNFKYIDGDCYYEENVDFMNSKGLSLPVDDAKKHAELRIELVDVYEEKFENKKSKFEVKCCTNYSKFSKFLNRKRGNINRIALGHICIGAGLSVEHANKLFSLQDFQLDPENNKFDAIVVACLENKWDIGDFLDICREENVKTAEEIIKDKKEDGQGVQRR